MEMIAWHLVLSVAAKYRGDYLRNFYELGKAGLSSPAEGAPVGYLIPAGQGRDENVAKMIGALVEQGVEVYRLDRELQAIVTGEQVLKRTSASGSTRGTNGLVVNSDLEGGELPAGCYLIFLSQPYRQNVL